MQCDGVYVTHKSLPAAMLTTRGLYEAAMNSEFLQLICELCVCACAGVSILVSQKQALEKHLVKKQQQ